MKYDTTGHMKDIKLLIVNVLLMIVKWQIVVRGHDRGYYSFTTRVNGKILNQMLLEVLRNCTLYFDLSSSLTASCFARFMIC